MERVQILQAEQVAFDDGLQFGMLYRKRLARDGHDAIHPVLSDKPPQHAVANHSRCAK